ncbi:MAG: hypothetical protein OXH38_05165 [Chloroflexi bacterium]|nr:hypothetical protein [Chloroflexota bacterium]MXZ53160.1 hypothetical protein [Acidimicrobiaceae bacterium]MYI86715.1 hypothetical protein [Dehalococcoidia bacterium]
MVRLAGIDDLYRVLVALNRHRVRATYGAVGEYLAHVYAARQDTTTLDQVPRIDQRDVGQAVGAMLHPLEPSWHTSWIVGKDTRHPRPSLYDRRNTHPDLERSSWIITTGAELALLCEL